MTLTGELADVDTVRAELRSWLGAHWRLDLTVREWWAELAESGWGFPSWPAAWFGRGLPAEVGAIVRADIAAFGAIGPPMGIAQSMGSGVLFEFGTEEQKARFMPAIANGTENWCQFFSEPNAGSDLASVQTKAVRDGDEWIVNGHKVWNGGSLESERGLLVARTDSDLPKHKGISFFIIDLDQPGIEIRPIKQMNGQAHFNEAFFTDARLPDDDLIGGLNNGWAVSMNTLSHERTTFAAGADYGMRVAPGPKHGMLDRVVGDVLAGAAAVANHPAAGFPMGSAEAMIDLARRFGCDRDPGIRQRIANLYAVAETARVTALRAKAAAEAGRPPGAESSIGYLAGVKLARLSRDLGLAILGAHGLLLGDDAPDGGAVQLMALTSLCHGIQGGTEQIQRNIVGERVLGLPKEPQVDRDIPFRLLPKN